MTSPAGQSALARATKDARPVDELAAFLEYVVEASATDRAVKAAAQRLGATPTNKTGEGHASAQRRSRLVGATARQPFRSLV